MDFELRQHTLLLVVAGSRAYGLHRPGSDVDVLGVAIPPPRYFYGFTHRFEQANDPITVATFLADLTHEEREVSKAEKLEGTVYHLAKFARLAADANPNVLDVLFARDAEVRIVTAAGQKLRAARDLFVSERARHTYVGYANAQLQRIQRHRRWLLDPPMSQPTRTEHGLPEQSLIPRNQLIAAEAAIQKKMDQWEIDFGELPASQVLAIQEQVRKSLSEMLAATDSQYKCAARAIGLDENFIELAARERQFKNAQREYRSYEGWKRSRNPARAALEASHGYDTKHGAHLVRLLRMGWELLTTGEVNVWRGDRDASELVAIRDGAWSYERLLEEANTVSLALQQLSKSDVVVPARPDLGAIDALVQDLVETALASARSS